MGRTSEYSSQWWLQYPNSIFRSRFGGVVCTTVSPRYSGLTMQEKTLLLSLRPRYEELVFAGTKTVELRRVRPRVQRNDWILVYVSTPVKALTGAIQVADVIENRRSTLWGKVRNGAGVTRRQFDEYYEGALKAYAIVVNAAL